MTYLGKRFLWQFLQEQGFNPSQMKRMEYKKYRGDEWLEDDRLCLYCVRQKAIYLSVFAYDECQDKKIEIECYSFFYDVTKWYKHYQRTKEGIKIFKAESDL